MFGGPVGADFHRGSLKGSVDGQTGMCHDANDSRKNQRISIFIQCNGTERPAEC